MGASKGPQGTLLIQKMVDAREETDRHIRIIERQISARAERMRMKPFSMKTSGRSGLNDARNSML
ncbi:hypothetical protein [Roseibium sp.]|uniref:hypothetical protein n=1 Tax=Roseibium sp. TaxID=1936156 RepID=UPI003D0F1904